MWRKANARLVWLASCCMFHTDSPIGDPEARNDLVSIERQYPLLRDVCQGGDKCGTGVPDCGKERLAARSRRTAVRESLDPRRNNRADVSSLDMSTILTQFSLIQRARRTTGAIVKRLEATPGIGSVMRLVDQRLLTLYIRHNVLSCSS